MFWVHLGQVLSFRERGHFAWQVVVVVQSVVPWCIGVWFLPVALLLNVLVVNMALMLRVMEKSRMTR